MQPELSLDDAAAFIEESSGLLCEAIAERDAICMALGVGLDVEVGELATAASRMAEAHDAQERLASLLLDVATSAEVENKLLRASLRDVIEETDGLREVLHEAMGVVGIDPGALDSVSDFIALLHELRDRRASAA